MTAREKLEASDFAKRLVLQASLAAEHCGGWTQDDDPVKLNQKRRRLTRALLRYIARLEREVPGLGVSHQGEGAE